MIEIRAQAVNERDMTIETTVTGDSDTATTELVCGVAAAIIRMADAMETEDPIHEALARVVGDGIVEAVGIMLGRREAGHGSQE